MTFDFNTKNSGVIHGFFNDITANAKEKVAGTYSIYESVNGKHVEYNRTVRIDEDGNWFFTWNKEKIMFNDFICDTPEKFIERVKAGDRVYGEHLCRTLLKHGMDSIHVMIKKSPMCTFVVGDVAFGFETDNGKEKDKTWVEYKFTEEYLHKPMNNYKLNLEPVNEEHIGVYARWDTYVDDMVALFKKCTDDYQLKVA